jgi:ParB family chromosome partitioning protein
MTKSRTHQGLNFYPLDEIEVDPDFNVRKNADPEEALVESIRQNGVINPIHVRARNKKGDGVVLIDGHRRLNAAREAEQKTIPAVYHGFINDKTAYLLALTTNKDQKKLTQREQYEGISRLSKLGATPEEISISMAIDVRTVSEAIRVQEKAIPGLKKAAKKGVREGGVNPRVAARAATLPKAAQIELLPKIEGKSKEEAVVEVRKMEEKLGVSDSRTGPKPKARVFSPKGPYRLAEDAVSRAQSMEKAIRAKLRHAPDHVVLNAQLMIIQCMKGEVHPADLFGWEYA